MANGLADAIGSPPAPNLGPGGAEPPQGNGLASAPSSGAPAQPQAPPPPTHEQVVVGLRHFHAIEAELSTLLSDPDCGKADMRSKIIDGASSLVGKGIFTAAEAVTQLGQVPDRPWDQREWLEQHFMQTVTAQTALLAHHQQGFVDQKPSMSAPSPDQHMADIGALAQHYKSDGAPRT